MKRKSGVVLIICVLLMCAVGWYCLFAEGKGRTGI